MHKHNRFKSKWLFVVLLWPLLLLSTEIDTEFAWQWPLVLTEPNAGAYQVTLDASVYQAVHWPDWRDIQVLDADNKPMPTALYPASKPQAQTASQFVDLPWFVLPTQTRTATDLNVVVKRDTHGRVITINDSPTNTPPANHSPSWLIDSGSHSGQLRALEVEWSDPEAILDVGYRLEASDDLRQWQVVAAEVRLLQLRNDEKQLRNNRITFTTQRRYLRLVPLQRNVPVPALGALRGEIVQQAVEPTHWHWLELAAEADHEPGRFEYRLNGRFPVQQLDVIMPANSTAIWQVFSLEEDLANTTATTVGWHWIMRSNSWPTYRINGKNALAQTSISPPLDLGQTLSSQLWGLQPVSQTALPAAPTLRLGWQAGRVLFLAQGRAPYTLVAGSATMQTKPNQHALEPMLAALRQHNAPNWQPAQAALAKAQVRAGDSAYQLPPAEFNWNKLLLWIVLISGVLIVAQFATHLLRRMPAQTQDDKSA